VIRINSFVRCVRGGVAAPRAAGPEPRRVEEKGPRGAPADAFIRRPDKDGDGKVSRKEFDGPPERFDDFDRNRNGFIDASEASTGPPPGCRGPGR